MAKQESLPVPASQATEWPQTLRDPNEVIGFGNLDADGRKQLAAEGTPFCITAAEYRAFPDGREAVVVELTIAPDSSHETPWQTSTMLSLPKNPDPERPGDRQRILNYFQENPDGYPVGPLVAVLVDVGQPSPYWAMRKANAAKMAEYAMELGRKAWRTSPLGRSHLPIGLARPLRTRDKRAPTPRTTKASIAGRISPKR